MISSSSSLSSSLIAAVVRITSSTAIAGEMSCAISVSLCSSVSEGYREACIFEDCVSTIVAYETIEGISVIGMF